MSEDPATGPARQGGRKFSKRTLIALLVTAGVLLFAFANFHLVYVAVTTQPDCVAPQAEGEDSGLLKPAKPAC